MKRLTFLMLFLSITAGRASPAETHGSVGRGHGILVPGTDTNPCSGELAVNFDGSAEDAYCWIYGGVAPPYYGTFAECYEGGNGPCGLRLYLTSVGHARVPCDLFVWEDSGGQPGSLIGFASQVDPGPVAVWPSVSTHDFVLDAATSRLFWLGYRADYSQQPCGYFVAADTDGFGGCPMTNIAPGIGFPTGWQNVSVVWGPTQALGIGAWLGGIGTNTGAPDPGARTMLSSWGRIKAAN
jgi:hypothetical protein